MSENDKNAPKEKRSFFGFRKTNKIEKAKNIPEAIGRILNIPKDKIIVNNKAYADKKEKEKREKEATDKFNQYLKETDNETSDENQTNESNTDSSDIPSDSPSDSSSAVSQSTTDPSDNSEESTSQGESSSKKKSKAVPIISSYQFDPSIGEEQQTQIKGVIGSLNSMLRLPELGLFADDEIEGKIDSVVTVEKIIDDDGEKQNPPKEIYIEPLIQIVE